MNIDCVSFDKEEDFSILTQFFFESTDLETDKPLTDLLAEEIKENILRSCGQEFFNNPARKLVPLNRPISGKFTVTYDALGTNLEVVFRINRLGSMEGGALIFNIGALFYQMCDSLQIDYQ